MHATLTSRLVFLVVLTVTCVVLMAVAVAGMAGNGSSNDPVPPVPASTAAPEVQHCLDAGGEPSRVDGEVACLIPPETLHR